MLNHYNILLHSLKIKKTFLKTALAVILFIPSTILGALFKGFAYLSKETGDRSASIKDCADKKITSPDKEDDPKAPPKKPEITICKFSELDHTAQQEALKEIALINSETSTVPGVNWDNYTVNIRDKVNKDSNILFLARSVDRFVGYAFFSRKGSEHPCCEYVALSKSHQGKGIGPKLEAKIFDEKDVSAFTAIVMKTNHASMKAFERFADRGYTVSKVCWNVVWHYTIAKPSVK